MDGQLMIVAGFDLSFTRSAGVWLDDYKVIYSFAKPIVAGPRRLFRAQSLFTRELHEHRADLVVVEDNAYGAPSRVVVVKLSQLNTLLKASCELLRLDWLEASPSKLKSTITGKGNAEKALVAQELDKLYNIKFVDDKGFDLSDASAAAVWGLQHRGLKKGV